MSGRTSNVSNMTCCWKQLQVPTANDLAKTRMGSFPMKFEASHFDIINIYKQTKSVKQKNIDFLCPERGDSIIPLSLGFSAFETYNNTWSLLSNLGLDPMILFETRLPA